MLDILEKELNNRREELKSRPYLEDKYNVSFDASSSYDFLGSIDSYYWYFGDKTTGWGKTIIHDYKEPGKYEVTLKVTDDDGTTDTTSWEVLLLPIIPDLIPDLSCEGNLIWEDVKSGETINGSFIVKNIGDSGSLLNWEIIEYPEWGDWTFTPGNGTDLSGGDFVNISVEVVAPLDTETEFTGDVKIVNTEDTSDSCEIEIYLQTPRTREHLIIGCLSVSLCWKDC